MIEIQPRNYIDATVTVPGSKSYTNRALIAAALARGESIIRNPLHSDDTRYMAEALNQLGIAVSAEHDGSFRVEGHGGAIPTRSAMLFVGNSGTTMRFLAAMLTLGDGTYVVDGVDRMRERPIQDLLDGLSRLGADARSVNGTGCPPVEVRACGLRGGSVSIPGDKSSQFFSAILLAAPYARADVEIRAEGPLASRPYVDMTISLMREFGAEAERSGAAMRVQAGRHYVGRDYTVECDASSASYFLAAAAVTGGRVRVLGLSRESAQGDVRFADALGRMGCDVCDGRTPAGVPFIEVRGADLHGIEIDMGDMSDVSMTLAAVAVFAEGPTRIFNVANMRLKETDRIAALAAELRRIGQDVTELSDGIVIEPRPVRPAVVRTYDDHRMAMSFAVIGLRAPGIVIENPSCVAKTFPDFFERLAAL
ncbi:MAG TPA: 3-phosphoshikimate 1-carboxyvinyltransferase [Planctomycetota bacterium]|nr:3-phosphoshikimate 1-carboxyvinyltransferase [Planctomycetota bacterium]